MKRLYVIIISLLLTLPILAQYVNTDQLFSAYSGREGYKTVVMGKKMIAMMQKESGVKSNVIENIRQISILSTEHSDSLLLNSAKQLATQDYELISMTNEDCEMTSFYINEDVDDEKRFLMIAHREDEEVIMEIIGDFRITDISKLSKLSSTGKK